MSKEVYTDQYYCRVCNKPMQWVGVREIPDMRDLYSCSEHGVVPWQPYLKKVDKSEQE